MAVTSDPATYTDLAPVIPEVWPPIVLEEMFAKAIAANFFTDLSEYMRDQGDIANVPGVFTNAFTASTQSTQGAELTTQFPAQDSIQLSINTHDYIALIVGDKDAKQLLRSFDFNKVYAKKAAGTLRIALEDALFGLWSGLSTNSVGDTATVLADAEIRESIYKLENANFDTLDGDVAWFFHPYTFYVQLGAISKYYDQSQRGPANVGGFTATGVIGQGNRATGFKGLLYGIPASVSSRVVSGLQTYRNLLAHKSAFGFATQFQTSPLASSAEESRVRAQASYELRNLGWLTVLDMIFGVIEMRDAAAVVVNGSSSFINS
jgi:hypothetical protein